MKHLSILLGLVIVGSPIAMAQWEDDIYYNPNKKEKVKTITLDNLVKATQSGRTDVTVDQYNMRGFGSANALAIDTIGAQVAAEPDFVYTGQIQKYYNPTIVVDNAAVLSDVINNSYGNVNVVINSGVPVFEVYNYNWPSYWMPSYGNFWYSSAWPAYWTPTYGYGWGAYTWVYNPVFGGYGFNRFNPYGWMWSPVDDYWSPHHPRHYAHGTYSPYGNRTYRLNQATAGRTNAHRHSVPMTGYRQNRNIHENVITPGGGRPASSGYRANSSIQRNQTQATLNSHGAGYRNNSSNRVERNGYGGLNGWGENTSGAQNNSFNNGNRRGALSEGMPINNSGGSRTHGGTMRGNGSVRSSMGGASTRGTATGGSRVGAGGGSVRR